jgi:hypothetical protein
MSFLSTLGSLFGWHQGQAAPPGPFTLSYADVCQARAILKTLNLPTELVLQVLDHAQYWPQHTFLTSSEKPQIAAARGGRSSHAVLCLDASIFNNAIVDPIRESGETFKVKAVEFECVSRDQGWTSEPTQGTFATSSWVEVSILRSDSVDNVHSPGPRFMNTWISSPSDLHQSVAQQGWRLVNRPETAEQGPQGGEGAFAWFLQGNRVAVGETGVRYRVVWAEDGNEGNEGAGSGEGFLKELKDGDRVLVWARAKVCGILGEFSSVGLIITVAGMAMHRRERQGHGLLWLLRLLNRSLSSLGTDKSFPMVTCLL